MKQYRFLGPLTAVVFPYLIFEAFHLGLFRDSLFKLPSGHFYIVSLVSILASIIAIVVGISGRRIRNTMYGLKLAEELHLKPEQLRAIVQGGLVHDVGKISVPDSVLNKSGKLLIDERALIERHPIDGYEMCRGLGFMKEELGIIRSHHEKWDGSGYPDKLTLRPPNSFGHEQG